MVKGNELIKASELAELEKLPGWAELTATQRETFAKQDHEIGVELEQIGKLRASVGARLLKIKEVAKRHRLWMEWLKFRGIPRGNAERWIAAAVRARLYLNANFAEIALEIGLDDIDIAYVLANPPKNSNDRQYVATYIKHMQAASKALPKPEIILPRSVLVAETVNIARSKFSKLPKNHTHREEQEMALEICGMLLAEVGLPATKVTPIAPPPKPKRGAPTLEQRAAKKKAGS